MKNFLFFLTCLLLITTAQAQLSSVVNKFPESKCVQCDYAEIDPTFSWPSPKTNPSTATKYSMVTGPPGATYGNTSSTPTSLARVTAAFSGAPTPLFGNSMYRYKINNTRDANTRTELYFGVGGGDFSDAQWFMAGIFVPNATCLDHRPFGLGFDFKHANAQGPANLNLKVTNGNWEVNFDYPQGAGEKKYNIGAVEKGKWTYILFNRNFTDENGGNPSGYWRVYTWVQGTTPSFTLKQQVLGPNYVMSSGSQTEGYVLFGPYVWGASGNEGSGSCDGGGFTMAPSYEFFYDNIIVAKSTATLQDFNNFISGATVPSNQSPIVNAGSNANITLPTNSYTFSGAIASDPDGSISSYLWEKLPGSPTGGIIVNNAILGATVNSLIAGTYTYRLTVTDNQSASSSDDIVITVSPSTGTTTGPRFTNSGCTEGGYLEGGCPSLPIPDRIITAPKTADSAIFYGVHGDTTGYIQSFSVVNLSKPGGTTVNTNQYLPQDTYIPTLGGFEFTGMTANGVYSWEVTVTDDKARSKKDTFIITRNAAANAAPTVNAGADQKLYVNGTGSFTSTSTTLRGLSADGDGTIESRLWARISGPANTAFGTPAADTTTATMLAPGAYTFRLTALDNLNASSFDDMTVSVVTCYAGVDTQIVAPTTSAPLIGTVTTGSTVASYAWTKLSGTGGSITNGTTLNATATGLTAGKYIYQLTVTFTDGNSVIDNKEILVVGAATKNYYNVDVQIKP